MLILKVLFPFVTVAAGEFRALPAAAADNPEVGNGV